MGAFYTQLYVGMLGIPLGEVGEVTWDIDGVDLGIIKKNYIRIGWD